jgi:hypothetical protein
MTMIMETEMVILKEITINSVTVKILKTELYISYYVQTIYS